MRYAALVAVLALVGCGMPTTISKTVRVEKDPQGNVLKIVEEETVIQRGANIAQLKMVHFKEAEAGPDPRWPKPDYE